MPCPRASFHLSRMLSIERRGGALAMSGRKDQCLIGKAGGDFPRRIAAKRPPYG